MKCLNCEYETKEHIKFCPECGTPMPSVDNVEANTSTPSPSTNEYTPPASASTYEPQSGDYGCNFDNGNVYNHELYTADQKINDYFTLNIVFLVLNAVTLCLCCGDGVLYTLQILIALGALTVSIIGVVYSNKVKKMLKAGNIQAALEASKVAKGLFLAGMILFIAKLTFAIIGFSILIATGGFDEFMKSFTEAFEESQYRY